MVSPRIRLVLLGFILLVAAGCTEKKNTASTAVSGLTLTPAAGAPGAVITPQQLAEQPGGLAQAELAQRVGDGLAGLLLEQVRQAGRRGTSKWAWHPWFMPPAAHLTGVSLSGTLDLNGDHRTARVYSPGNGTAP